MAKIKKYMDKISKKNILTNFQKNILTNFQKKYMDKFPKKIYGQKKLAPHWLAGWLAGSSLADV